MDILIDDVTIRQAVLDDAQDIANVHVASWQRAYSGVVPARYLASLDPTARAEQWHKWLSRDDQQTFVAIGNSRLLGFTSIGPSRDEDAEPITREMYTLYLDPEAWGSGVARELMHTVSDTLEPGTILTLWVLADNERAIRFYHRHGFHPDGVERMEEFDDTPLLEVRLVRQ